MSFFMLILLGIPVLSLIWFVWALRSTAMPAGGFAELARRSPLGAQAERQLGLTP